MKDLVSVIIPAFNCETTIEVAVQSTLNQTHENLEVIVVDDHSTDKTAEVVRSIKDPRVTLVTTETDDGNRFSSSLNRNINAGYAARNTGFKYAKGEYITFQDADDASVANRIEIQLGLLKKYNAAHVTLDWFKFDESYLDKKFNLEKFEKEQGIKMLGPMELIKLAEKTRGILMNLPFHSIIPFGIKRARIVNKLFFGDVTPYPGVTGIPLFKREIMEKIQFRPLRERVWPSFMGRGVDRDYSFRAALLFKNSYVFFIPTYMWRKDNDNPRFKDIKISDYLN
jgi:glycosyltransferase involved in cell wall biosynthesis